MKRISDPFVNVSFSRAFVGRRRAWIRRLGTIWRPSGM